MTQELTYFQSLLIMLIGHGKIKITETNSPGFKITRIEAKHEDYNQELWDLQNLKYTELKRKGQAEPMIGSDFINFEPMINFMRTRDYLASHNAFNHSVKIGSVDMIEDIGDFSKITVFKYA
jgi:hypothetical protein